MLKFSMNIANLIFLSWPDSGRSSTGRFLENCAPRKTLQLPIKMQNIHAFAVPKTANYAISYVFCRLFWFPTFVSKLLCDKLANSAIILGSNSSMCIFHRKYVYILQPSPPSARQPGRPPASPASPASPPASLDIPHGTPSLPMTAHMCVNVSVLRPICAGLSARHALPHAKFVVNITDMSQLGQIRVQQPELTGNANGFPTGTCCVRRLLRQSPTAAAEWAKPREIRRGTSVEAPEGASGCRTAVSNHFNTISAILLSEIRARPVLPDPLGPELTNIEKRKQK